MKNTGPSRRSVLGASGLLLIFSFFFPYWEALLASGSRADGLELQIYLTHAGGALREQLTAPEKLLRLEHSTAAAAGLALVLLLVAAALAERPWTFLLCLPALLLPAVVGADAAGYLAGCEAQLELRPGAGVFIAGGAAALLAAAMLRELWKISRRA
jgi:hypothetical protein